MSELRLVGLRADGQAERAWRGISIPYLPFVLGRQRAADSRLQDEALSRRHCAFYRHDGRVWVQDLDSANGTRLNGEPLTRPRPLADGDRLELAHVAFQVRLSRAAPSAGRVPVLDHVRQGVAQLVAGLVRRPC